MLDLPFAAVSDRRQYVLSPRRRLTNLAMRSALVAATALVLSLLLLIVGYVVVKGASAINFSFFTQLPAPVGSVGGGIANALVGTVELILLASCLGIPIGILSGIYLAEFGDNPLADVIGFVTDILTGVPSIIVGVFAYAILVVPFHQFSALSGGLALGILMIPIVTRTTAGILALVPRDLREGSLALGVGERQTILRVVIPAAAGGIATGVMLAIARVAGETAPLLFTAFGNQYWQFSVGKPIAALPLLIFQYAISPYADWHAKAWAGSFLLIVLVFIASLLTRLATRNASGGLGRQR
ncbi:MAG: phosphate ABC transporter permease PstA [Chloroflexota bacterium]